jgi:hypothetical protein
VIQSSKRDVVAPPESTTGSVLGEESEAHQRTQVRLVAAVRPVRFQVWTVEAVGTTACPASEVVVRTRGWALWRLFLDHGADTFGVVEWLREIDTDRH